MQPIKGIKFKGRSKSRPEQQALNKQKTAQGVFRTF